MDLREIRSDFPLMKEITFLNSATTTMVPVPVANAIRRFELEQRLTARPQPNVGFDPMGFPYDLLEESLATICRFLDAPAGTVGLTACATHSCRMVARNLKLRPGDNIVTSQIDYHSCVDQWRQVAEKVGAELRMIPVSLDGEVPLDAVRDLMDERTRIVSVVHASNILGVCLPCRDICRIAREKGVLSLVDATESVGRMPISVRDFDCDFLIASSHKALGPTGTGLLFVRPEINTDEHLHYPYWLPQVLPGSANFSGAFAMAEAFRYIEAVGLENVHSHIRRLSAYLTDRLRGLDNVVVYGPEEPGHLVLMHVPGSVPEEISALLREHRVIIRALPLGHFMRPLGLGRDNRALRVSFHVFNNESDVDRMIDVLVGSDTIRRKP